MRSMTIRTTHSEVLEATEHLPDGATLLIHGFGWDEYERLLVDLGHSPHLRVSYDGGNLRIVSISPEHEDYATAIEGLILTFCDDTEITLEGRGRATWRQQALEKGVEADACYYIQNAKRIIGKRKIALAEDPPPDLAIEIDLSTEARHKFPIYAALGVPEIWRYDGELIQFYLLRDGDYVEASTSEVLPGLPRDLLIESLNVNKTEGQTAARKYLREEIRQKRS
jgi:Uma2 family endonuclease